MCNFGYLLGIPAPKALALAPKALATTRHCAEGARHCAEGAGCGDSCSAPRICLEGACQRPKFSKGRLRRAFGQWGPSARLAISCATLAARLRGACTVLACMFTCIDWPQSVGRGCGTRPRRGAHLVGDVALRPPGPSRPSYSPRYEKTCRAPQRTYHVDFRCVVGGQCVTSYFRIGGGLLENLGRFDPSEGKK